MRLPRPEKLSSQGTRVNAVIAAINRHGGLRHSDASLGFGLCQEPSESMSLLASFGPQLPRL